LLLAGVIYVGNGWWWQELQVALGLPFIFFFPGYVLIASLYPGKVRLSGIGRVALSFGLSMVMTPLIGLGLKFTPWGIGLTTMLVFLIIFSDVISAIAWYRRRRLPAEDAFIPTFEFELTGERSGWSRVLTAMLILFILTAISAIIYVTYVPVPKTGDRFTEFYILGPDGRADGYPTDLTVGQPAQVIVGVINHEYDTVNYKVQVQVGDQTYSTTEPIGLTNGQKWEQPIEFSANMPQQKMEVQFLLFRQGYTSPYRLLHLWVNVKAPTAQLATP
jgi:uncharacterized membrane protein